jgi:2'-5' RNA ligase
MNPYRLVNLLLEENYKFSCVMLMVPETLSAPLQEWSEKHIPDKALFVDDDGGKGREDECHVTVLYGLTDAIPSENLMEVLESTRPFEVYLGKVSLFENDEFDVVKCEVISPALHALNKRICASVDYENDHPVYKPHCTIAYVKKGAAKKLVGQKPFDDADLDPKFTVTEIVFSSKNGDKQTLSLGKRQPQLANAV